MDRPKRITFTDDAVRALPPAAPGTEYIVRDATLPGFFVRVGAKGRPAYTIQVTVRVAGRKRTKKEVIGRVGEMTAREARAAARKRIGDLQTGAARPLLGKGPTLREAWGRYEQGKLLRRGRQPRTFDFYKQAIEGRLADLLDMPLSQITAAVARDRHDALTRRSGPYAANGAMRAMRAVYRHARRSSPQLPADDPTAGVDWNEEHRRNTAQSATELAAWWAQLQRLDNPIRREFHLLTLLSGSRPDALRKAR